MDMENPGLCPRCQRPPMYTPAELVITKVEDMAPEDRFWRHFLHALNVGLLFNLIGPIVQYVVLN